MKQGLLTRRGFTLVEVLVVFGIIAVLIGILIPAVMSVRERAYLAQSVNNLRQIDLAAANYAGAHGRLPPLNPKFPIDRAGVFVSLLPYLEQDALARWLVDSSFPIQNYKGIKIVPVFLSPLDPDPVNIDFSFWITGREITNYACNSYAFYEKPRLEQFTDGLSSTIFFSEHYQKCGPVEFRYTSGGGASRFDPILPGPASAFANGGPQINPGDNCEDFYPITAGSPPVSTAANNATFQVRPRPADCDPRLPNSTSAQGLQIAMGDGSVHLLAPSIAPSVFWGMVTPRGGEIIDADW